jgi:hypothetical protein
MGVSVQELSLIQLNSHFFSEKRKVSCGKENQNGTAVCSTEAWVGISLWRNIYALYFFRLLGLTS